MKILPTMLAFTAVAFTVFALSPRTALAEEWMLMGREGGCVTIAEAAERRPMLSDIATPDQLVERLRAEGETVSRQDIDGGNGVTAVLIDAPGHKLGLIFVPPSACR